MAIIVVNENEQVHVSDTSEDSEWSLSLPENSLTTNGEDEKPPAIRRNKKLMRICLSIGKRIIRELLDNNHFIDRQSSNLIRKVTRVNPILNDLMRYTPLTYIQNGHIQRQSTNQEKMQALYNIVKDWSKNDKDDVYKILKQHHGELIRELKKQDKAPDKNHFINRHRSEIIAKSSAVNAILDDLFLKTKLKLKQYNNIQSQSTNQEKMKALYRVVEDWSEGDKDLLYELLTKHNGELIRELENQDKRLPSILWEKNPVTLNTKYNGLSLFKHKQDCTMKSKTNNQKKMEYPHNWWANVRDGSFYLPEIPDAEDRQADTHGKGHYWTLMYSHLKKKNPVTLNTKYNGLSLFKHKQDCTMKSKTNNQKKMEYPHNWWANVRDGSFYLPEIPDAEDRQADTHGKGHYWTLMYSHLKNHFIDVNKAMSTARNNLGTILFPILLCSLAGLPAASCETHRLWYSQTGILKADKYPPEFTFQTAGFVDDEQIDKYSHLTRRDEPVASWMERHEDEGYWHQETMSRIGWEKVFKDNLQILSLRINETLNPVTLQHFYACELGEDGSHRGYYQYGLNGKEFLHLDEETMMWIPAMHEAQISADRWNRDPSIAADVKHYLDERCPKALKKYVGFMKQDSPNKNVSPEVKVWGHKAEKETKLHCLVYGFYPRAVDVKWVRNGVEHILSHEISPILPHPDGTYQIRVNVEVPRNEEDSYSCLVDHSTLEEPVSVICEPTIPVMERTWIITLGLVTSMTFMTISLFLIAYKGTTGGNN